MSILSKQISIAYFPLLIIFVSVILTWILTFFIVLKNKRKGYDDYERQLRLYRTNQWCGVFIVDIEDDYTFLYANDKYYQIHEYSKEEIHKKFNNICGTDIFPEDLKYAKSLINDTIKSGGGYVSYQIRIISGKGKLKYLFINGIVEKQNGKWIINGTSQDITNQKLDQLALEHENQVLELKAKTDSLTGLYNVTTANDLIVEYLRISSQNRISALLMIDIDNFKMVNDTLGHYEGNHVLIRVADEMRKHFVESDVLGRIGGDEFIVFMKNIPTVGFARKKAKDLCNDLQFTISNAKESAPVTASIGIAICRNGEKDYETLYQEADSALYQVKSSGKKNVGMIPT